MAYLSIVSWLDQRQEKEDRARLDQRQSPSMMSTGQPSSVDRDRKTKSKKKAKDENFKGFG